MATLVPVPWMVMLYVPGGVVWTVGPVPLPVPEDAPPHDASVIHMRPILLSSPPRLLVSQVSILRAPAAYWLSIRFLKTGSRFVLSISASPVSTNAGKGEVGSRK